MPTLSWQLELTDPFLLGALLALVPLAYFFARSLVDLVRWQRVTSLILRGFIVCLLVLSLAGLTLLRTSIRPFVVLAVDDSLSVGDDAARKAQDYVRRVQESAANDQVAVVRFASSAEDGPPAPSPDGNATRSGSRGEEPDSDDNWRTGTNLEQAIEMATAKIPPFHVPHIVLITDGNQTDGDAVRAALASGVRVSTVPLPTRDEPEVQVSAVHVPAQVRQGEPFYVEAIVDSSREAEGTIEVYRDEVRVDDNAYQATRLKRGENRFRFRQEVNDERKVTFTVRVSGFPDEFLDNNSASALVSTQGKPRLILVDSETAATDHLRWALEEQNIIAEVRPPEGIPSSLSELLNYDAIILSNVPASALSGRQMEVIRAYVQDLGGGMMMLGGEQSFGLGGYHKTLLEELLPLYSDMEQEKEKPSLAMVLAIDKSGSMGGMKIELAKDAAKGAVELLSQRDRIGVIAFDGQSYWVSEVRSAADKELVSQRISTIEAGGGTSLYPPMVQAYEALLNTTAKLKHVIVMTDGKSAPGDFEGITTQMAADQMTVSTVAVGEEADRDLLQRIARLGNGRYYACDDPQSVPQIFAQETLTASKKALHETPFLPRLVRSTPVLRDLDLDSAPFLLGFVTTRPKPTCELILTTETGEPLLAWWRYGLGVTVAFTSDATSRWAVEWLSWPQFSTFWAQVVRHAMRKTQSQGVYVEMERQGKRTEVRLDSIDALGRFRNHADTVLTVTGPEPGRETQSVAMRQLAPGRYVAQIDTAREGTYHLDLAQSLDGQSVFRQSRGLIVGYPEELRLRPTNTNLLEKIAQVSGGTFDPVPSEVLDVGDRTAKRTQPLRPILLAAVALLFLADVALRRVDFSLVAGRRW